LLDTSVSMSGAPINALNEGIKVFKEELNQDDLAAKRVELAVISFDSSVNVVQDFVTADQFEPTELTTGGLTQMGAAIEKALDMISNRKSIYRNNGITYYRPWVFMITDGAPTDSDVVIERVKARIKEEEAKKSLAMFAVGVENADIAKLSEIVVRSPLQLKGLYFREMFSWLSNSITSVSQSRPGEQVPLLPPSGWSVV
jgi:uncharacterized protein YegL